MLRKCVSNTCLSGRPLLTANAYFHNGTARGRAGGCGGWQWQNTIKRKPYTYFLVRTVNTWQWSPQLYLKYAGIDHIFLLPVFVTFKQNISFYDFHISNTLGIFIINLPIVIIQYYSCRSQMWNTISDMLFDANSKHGHSYKFCFKLVLIHLVRFWNNFYFKKCFTDIQCVYHILWPYNRLSILLQYIRHGF